ncbi:efflux RND transporter periplasmic adaptor subunit [Anaerorudis cellulosivorans]|uniref:efflux RND transporter periplasmic adaptor subunit n=1 Tax=Anaerorudis cellulosivorans TaxID=3397862 RepID=UPI00221F23B6|nr:efflux RND transporter periplasmic adaptor subunit [Seramator thermalis]MCW1735356.1 efflux RND transporter periplasmic adaptor subunit [Seramator thermalis]
MRKYNCFLFSALCLAMMGCHSMKEERHVHEHEHEGMEEHDLHAGEIVFHEEQARAAGLEVITVSPSSFTEVIHVSGQIQSTPDNEATVVSASAGVVDFAGKYLTEGMSVKSGTPLVTVSAKNMVNGDPSVAAEVEYESALREYERAKSLVADRLISQEEFEQIRLRYEKAKNARPSAVTSSGVTVSSPIEGYIKKVYIKKGDYVDVGQPVVVVSRDKRLQLRAEVSEKYADRLPTLMGANFKPSYGDTLYKLSDLNGRLISYGRSVDDNSFYIPVIFDFDNRGDIIPGSYVEVFLLSLPLMDVIAVPVSALTEEEGLHFVYVQLEKEIFKKQEVRIGLSDGERVRILSGLKEGDRVVTKGTYQVKLAATASVIPEGHSHAH